MHGSSADAKRLPCARPPHFVIWIPTKFSFDMPGRRISIPVDDFDPYMCYEIVSEPLTNREPSSGLGKLQSTNKLD
jgi:hypothetical protein